MAYRLPRVLGLSLDEQLVTPRTRHYYIFECGGLLDSNRAVTICRLSLQTILILILILAKIIRLYQES